MVNNYQYTYNQLKNILFRTKTEFDAHVSYDIVRIQWEKLRKTLPEIDSLKLKFSNQDTLDLGGINLMVDNLKTKKGGENIHCFVCEDIESFQESLKKLKQSTFQGKISFLVRSARSRNDNGESPHITPVLIKKEGQNLKIVVTDSIGTKSTQFAPKGTQEYQECKNYLKNPIFRNFTYSFNIYSAINDLEIDDIKLYLTKDQRQRNTTSCYVFSLNDILYFFRNVNFFEDIEKNGGVESDEKDKRVHYINHLPEGHMKFTQSMSQLRDYIKEHKSDLLKRSVEKSSRKEGAGNSDHMINMKAVDRHFKNLIKLEILSKKTPIETLRAMTTRYNANKLSVEKLNALV